MFDSDGNQRRTESISEKNGAGQAVASRQQAISRRTLIVLLLAAVCFVATAALLLELFVARRIPPLTADRLDAARELWNQNGPASYDLDLEMGGERPGPVHVEVRNGEVVAMTRDDRTPEQRLWMYWAVPGQFDLLERELALAEDPMHEAGAQSGTVWEVRCEFDPQSGLPRRYQRNVFGGGPNFSWQVTHFVVR
jgi:hypothetical protein